MNPLLAPCALAALLAAAPAAPASDADQVVSTLQQRALEDDTAWRLLESLTVEVGPRMAGTEGDRLGVAWAERKMGELGFDRVWLEPVEFPLWVRRGERARIVQPREQQLVVTALGGSPSSDGPVSAEVAHFPDLEALEAAAPERVEDRIVFISRRMERSRSGAGYGETVPQRSRGPMVAAAKGARALLIRSVGTDDNRFAHTGNISSTTPGERVPSAALANPDADLLLAMLERGERVTVELDLDVGYEGTGRSHNVIGEFDGRGDGEDFVVVGAHLDSWDLGTGAHDDGAGVAITMAAAKLVADLPRRPLRGTRVVLFANEEQGIFGAKEYARVHADELDRHLIGAESDLGAGRIYQFRTRVAPAADPLMDRLAELLAPLGIPRQHDRPANGGADLGQMRRLGMPVVDLNHDASLYFDYHHTLNDTLDKVNPQDLAFNVAAYVTFIWFAADSDARFGPVAPSE